MTEDAEFLRAQARKCRWLSERIATQDVVDTLRTMAEEYDARAETIVRGAQPEPAPREPE